MKQGTQSRYWDSPEGLDGEEVGRGSGWGTCVLHMADSCQCTIAKILQHCKVINIIKTNKSNVKKKENRATTQSVIPVLGIYLEKIRNSKRPFNVHR